MDEKNVFSQMDFGPLSEFLEDDDVTDISYSNGGQVWLKTLSKGVYQVERPEINNPFMEKLAFQCSNVMGRTFNMAHPFLDAESAELRMNFVHDSIATNGVACLIRKTPAKIRLNKGKLLDEQYITEQMHDFLIKCVWGHCNILVAGETGSGKTELVKYLASNTKENEKIISIEDTLELHLDKIFPHRDIVSMKTNNIASYTEALVACMRQNPIWILLAEVRSAEAVMAVRNSISSGHHIISTIHADKASSIPMRMYALLEGSQDIEQYLGSIHRYVQIGIYVKGYYSKVLGRFQREIMEICEFYVDDDTNRPMTNILYSKTLDGKVTLRNPTKKLIDYLAIGNVYFDSDDIFGIGDAESKEDTSIYREGGQADNLGTVKATDVSKMDKMMNGEEAADASKPNVEKNDAQSVPVQAQQAKESPKTEVKPVVNENVKAGEIKPAQATQAQVQSSPVVNNKQEEQKSVAVEKATQPVSASTAQQTQQVPAATQVPQKAVVPAATQVPQKASAPAAAPSVVNTTVATPKVEPVAPTVVAAPQVAPAASTVQVNQVQTIPNNAMETEVL